MLKEYRKAHSRGSHYQWARELPVREIVGVRQGMSHNQGPEAKKAQRNTPMCIYPFNKVWSKYPN